MNILIQFVISLVGGGVASVLTVAILFKIFRPKIEIAPKISKSKRDNGYKIKILNKSKNSLYDIRCEAEMLTMYNIDEGVMYEGKKLDLKFDHLPCIEKFDRNDRDGKYAIVFTINDNIEELWDAENKSIRFVISAKHSFSNFNQVFSRTYNTKNTIKKGDYTFGNSFEIN